MRQIITIILVLILAMPPGASASHCHGLWQRTWKRVKISSIVMKREFAELKGWRLVFRHTKLHDNAGKGFFPKYVAPPSKDLFDRYQSFIQFFPRQISKFTIGTSRDFHFLDAVRYYTLDQAVQWGTKKYFGERMQPTLLMSMPIDVAFYAIAMSLAFSTYANHRVEKMQSEIEANKEVWDRYKTDFRYQHIRIMLENGEITAKEAREWVAILSTDYQFFLELLRESEMKFTDPTVQDILLAMPPFGDIVAAMKTGLVINSEFKYHEGFNPELTKEQIDELVSQKIFTLLMYDVAYAAVEPSLEVQSQGSTRELIQKLKQENYIQALFELNKRGTINRAQLVYHIQEDIFWRMQFNKWELLKVSKLKKDDDGSYRSQTLLTLTEVRKSNLNAIMKGYTR